MLVGPAHEGHCVVLNSQVPDLGVELLLQVVTRLYAAHIGELAAVVQQPPVNEAV
jgi:hypothetical protein